MVYLYNTLLQFTDACMHIHTHILTYIHKSMCVWGICTFGSYEKFIVLHFNRPISFESLKASNYQITNRQGVRQKERKK